MGSLCPQCGHRFAVIDIGSQQLGHCCMAISRKGPPRDQTALRREHNVVSNTRQLSQSELLIKPARDLSRESHKRLSAGPRKIGGASQRFERRDRSVHN